MTSKANKISLLLGITLFSLLSHAAVIEFEADEIPSESVMPVLDSTLAVKNKLVPLKGRAEVGLLSGTVIDEMFFNNVIWGVQLFYNMDNDTAVGLKYTDHLKGLSSYADQFRNTSKQLDFNKAPAPSTLISGSYRWTFLYGKISLSKNMVIPTLFSTETDLGLLQVGQENLPYAAIGITHKFYIKQHWGVGLSYRLLAYQTLNPVSVNIGSSAPAPSESAFTKKVQLSQSLDLTLSFLF